MPIVKSVNKSKNARACNVVKARASLSCSQQQLLAALSPHSVGRHASCASKLSISDQHWAVRQPASLPVAATVRPADDVRNSRVALIMLLMSVFLVAIWAFFFFYSFIFFLFSLFLMPHSSYSLQFLTTFVSITLLRICNMLSTKQKRK